MLAKLKIKIIERHGSQIVAARVLGIEETRLSRIVRGHVEPRAEDREKLVAAFGAESLTKRA